MSWAVAAGQIWEAEDESARVEVVDKALQEPTARYDLPVTISVKQLTDTSHSAIEEKQEGTVIKRDTLLQEFQRYS